MILIYLVVVPGAHWLDITVRHMEGVPIGRLDTSLPNSNLSLCIDSEKLEQKDSLKYSV